MRDQDLNERPHKREQRMRKTSFESKVLLGEWMRDNIEWIMSERPTMTKVGEKAGAALGFDIHPLTVSDVARVYKIHWTPDAPLAGGGRLRARLNAQEREIQSLNERIHTLEEKIRSVEGQQNELLDLISNIQHGVQQLVAVVDNVSQSRQRTQADTDNLRCLVNLLYHHLNIRHECVPAPPSRPKIIGK